MQNTLRASVIIILFSVMIYFPSELVFSQTSEDFGTVSTMGEWIKIGNLMEGQNVSSGKALLISGQSSDNIAKDCSVSVIVNDVRPYRNAVASGPEGSDDFSKWKFILDKDYTHLNEGENRITAKLLCTSVPTRWYSVSVNGVSSYNNEEILSPILPGNQSNVPVTTLSNTTHVNGNDKYLHVSIFPQKNPIARGDTQNLNITVTDSYSKPIPNAKIIGKLIYPGGNYEKDFSGTTDDNGKFLYSWTIGKNGDIGPLSMEIDASSPLYGSQSISDSFSVVGLSESSVINTKSYTSDITGSTSFVATGDFYCDARTKKTTNAIQDKNPDLVLALGDLSEVKNPNCFFNLLSKVDKEGKLKIVLGSDDIDNVNYSQSRYNQYMRHFNLKEPFYSFDYNNIHFVAMATGKDSLIPFGPGSPQYNFIVNDLKQASNDENIDWIVVFGYRHFYSSPSAHPGSSLKSIYPQIFDEYGVDLVLSAHIHNYQRTYPILFNSDRPGKPLIKDGNITSDYENLGAPMYVTAGTAGADLHDLPGQSTFVASQFSEVGFVEVNVTGKGTEKQLQSVFVNSNNGTKMDHFSITKS